MSSIKLSPEEKLYLTELVKTSKEKGGEWPKPREILVKLHGKLPTNFDPKSIDPRVLQYGRYPTLLGISLVDPKSPLLKLFDKFVKAAKKHIKDNPGLDKISSTDFPFLMKLGSTTMQQLGSLVCSELGHDGAYGGESFSVRIDNFEVTRRYLDYNDLKDYLKNKMSEKTAKLFGESNTLGEPKEDNVVPIIEALYQKLIEDLKLCQQGLLRHDEFRKLTNKIRTQLTEILDPDSIEGRKFEKLKKGMTEWLQVTIDEFVRPNECSFLVKWKKLLKELIDSYEKDLFEEKKEVTKVSLLSSSTSAQRNKEREFSQSKRDVFLSHNCSDKTFVRRLAKDLKSKGIRVWFDDWEMKVGDSLTQKIQDGIKYSGYFAVVLSPDSVKSKWVQKELSAGLIKELEGKRVFVLPLLYKDCELPPFLKDKIYADFRKDYNKGFGQLLARLTEDRKISFTEFPQEKMTIHSLDNSTFLVSRKKEWSDFVKDNIWIISSITPLKIYEDAIDPLKLKETINSLKLPEHISRNPTVNHYHTQSNEHGVINEDLRDIKDGSGHQIQIFRNGHCEFLICLERSTRQIIKAARDKHPKGFENVRVLRYTDVAECFVKQIQGLKNIWNTGLPFNDMLLTAVITNTKTTCLYSKERTWGDPVFVSTVNSKTLEYSKVINKKLDLILVLELVIKRFINYFGLNADTVFDKQGNLIRPECLSY